MPVMCLLKQVIQRTGHELLRTDDTRGRGCWVCLAY